NKIHDSVKVKNGCKRLRARTTTLLEQKVVSLELTHSSTELKTQWFPA
ncbi:MAG: endonuclease, partial [Euryarchaeota archaeon]|nr:endonuclease [Euryarchaeota archaeon]